MAMGELPGRLSTFFGFDESGLKKEDEAMGMNPRRAYWSAALADLSNQQAGKGFQGAGLKVNEEQQKFMLARQQQEQMNEYRDAMATAALTNAWRDRDKDTPAMKNAAALGLKPGTPEYNDYIREATKKGPLVDLGDKSQAKYNDVLLKNLPKVQDDAMSAVDELGRVDAMEQLIDSGNLGRTGVGKETMTSVNSFLSQMGMGWAPDFINTMAKSAGFEDIFTGNRGAIELFRALSSSQVLERAKELYPVSNRDIDFLREMNATLSMSSPEAMKSILGRRRQQQQMKLDSYNWYRESLKGFDNVPQLPEIKPYNTHGLTTPNSGGTLTPEQQKRYDELKSKM